MGRQRISVAGSSVGRRTSSNAGAVLGSATASTDALLAVSDCLIEAVYPGLLILTMWTHQTVQNDAHSSDSETSTMERRRSTSAARVVEPSNHTSRNYSYSTAILRRIDLVDCIPVGTLSVASEDANHDADADWTRAFHLANIIPNNYELKRVFDKLNALGRLAITYKVNPRDATKLLLRVYFQAHDRVNLSLRPWENLSSSDYEFYSSELDGSNAAWNGQEEPDRSRHPALHGPEGKKSLLDFYNTLPSPELDATLMDCVHKNEAIQAVLRLDRIVPGLTTPLYPYQQRSVATMIRREEHPERFLDPLLNPMVAADGSPYYCDPHRGQLLLDRRDFPACRGGILAETMGLGYVLHTQELELRADRIAKPSFVWP